MILFITKDVINMHTRVKQARKALGLSQLGFGARLGVSNTAISKIEKGENNLTDQMIKAMGREFNISEDWLRYGKGEMFKQLTVDEEFIQICVDIQVSDDDFIKRALRTYWGMDDATKAMIRKLINDLADK